MSNKGFVFNGKVFDIPKKYIKNIELGNSFLIIEDNEGNKTKFIPPIVGVEQKLISGSKNAIGNGVVADKINEITEDIKNINETYPNVIDFKIQRVLDSNISIEAQKNFRTIGLLGRDVTAETEIYYPLSSYTVENLSTDYVFALNDSGYYESGNKGKDSSYCLCRVNFTMNEIGSLEFEIINYAESNYDFGIFSQIDQTLSSSYSEDTSSTLVYKSYKGIQSATPTTLTYSDIPAGEHFITIKFKKDSSASNGNDSLQFKITTPYGSYTEVITTPVINKLTTNDSDELLYNGEAVAREGFVKTEIANLVNSAPETLDTLGELATALEENKDIVETLNSAITNKVDKTTTGSSSYNTYSSVDNENKDGIMIGSFVGTEAPAMDGTSNVEGTAIRTEGTSGAISHIKMADAVTTSTDIAVDETQASLTYMKHDGSSEGTNVSQNGIFVQEDMLSGQIYKVTTDASTGESTTNASNISLSSNEVLVSQQTTVGEETTSSTLSLKDGTAYLNDKELATKDDVNIDTSNLVDLTSEQTISGHKIFSNTNLTANVGVLSGYHGIDFFTNGYGISMNNSGSVSIGGKFSNAFGGNNLITIGGNYSMGAQGGNNIWIGSGGVGQQFAKNTMCLGFGSKGTVSNIIQLGAGTNSTENTFQVFDYQLLDAEGKIPNERLNITFDTATTDEIDALFT